MCARGARICFFLCVACKKALLEPPFCWRAAVCRARATGPFSICVLNLSSFHTLTHIFMTPPTSLQALSWYLTVGLSLSPSLLFFFLLLPVFIFGVCLVVSLNTAALCRHPCSLTRGIMQSYQKRVVSHACLWLHATLHSYQKLPFLPFDPLS